MKKTIYNIIAITMLVALMPAKAVAGDFWGDLQVNGRAGYNIGGTAPVPLPRTIRSIESYTLTPSFMVGVDAEHSFDDNWGLMAGLRIENKAMKGAVKTKAYHMELVRGNSVMDGLFTGKVEQNVTEWMVTIPVEATLNVSRVVKLKMGPYISYVFSRSFDGIASDGYLRQGTSTGPKILLGNKEGEWATYDFSDDMRSLQFGIALGADFKVGNRWGLSADLNWGLTGIFNSDFKTVEQTLYPIYGTVGVFYRLK